MEILEELEQLLQRRINENVEFKNAEYNKLKSEYNKLKSQLVIVTIYYNKAEDKICRLEKYIKTLEEKNDIEEKKLNELQKRYDELKFKHKIAREEKYVLNQEYLKLLRRK